MAWQIAEERKAFLESQPRNPPPASPAPIVFDVEYRSEWRSQYAHEIMAARAYFGLEHKEVGLAREKDRGRER